jgi:hypothetical protein
LASSSRTTSYRVACIFVFAFVNLIMATNVRVTVIISTHIVVIAIYWGVGTSRSSVTIIISTSIVIIARNSG